VTTRARRDESGTALLEFALVAVLLFTLIFGIISYSYMMSFRQALTQAAAEGARAGAIAPAAQTTTNATAAVNDAIGSYGGVACGSGGLTCTVTKLPCTSNTARTCVTVTVAYPYASQPLLPGAPGMSFIFPDVLDFTSVAEANP
jgi:Flp pilus assembly protein TadG